MHDRHTLLRFVTGEVGGFMGERPVDSKSILDEYPLDVNQGAPPLAENEMIQRGQREPRVIQVGLILEHPGQTAATAPSGWSSWTPCGSPLEFTSIR